MADTVDTRVISSAHRFLALAPTSPPQLICYSQVTARPMEWLWPGYIPLGKLSFLVGEPGLGKGLLVADLAARVTCGGAWPGPDGGQALLGSALILHAEDDREDTMVQRLKCAGANLERIFGFDTHAACEDSRVARPFSLRHDLGALEAALAQTNDCRLVVIDPIAAYLGGADGNHNGRIRELLHPLGELAKSYRVAILAVAHLNKRESGSAVNRGLRFSLAKPPGALAPRVEWSDEPVAMSFQSARATGPRFNLVEQQYRDKETHMVERLRDELTGGPVPCVYLEAEMPGTEEQHYRAAEALGVIKVKDSYAGGWIWMLPEHYAKWREEKEEERRQQKRERQWRKKEKARKARAAKLQGMAQSQRPSATTRPAKESGPGPTSKTAGRSRGN